MPRAFSEKERNRIRDRLIAAGRRLINKGGVRFLVVDDVAREARISKGSFYAFFPSREDFILTVFESWEREHRGALIEMVTTGRGTPREKLERFFIGAFEIIDREPGLARLGFQDIQAIIERLPPERIVGHQAADRRVLEEAARRWEGEGLLAPGVAEALPGLAAALFSIVLHKEDFPPGSYRSAQKLIAEALAVRMAAGTGRAGDRPRKRGGGIR
ncbi:MAG: TetR/AcrR family transcriptional regulator [Acidobacteriota bacterium]|nr:TetR/AcrR family transcriptional regulator [Acidobacteriota bacterium]